MLTPVRLVDLVETSRRVAAVRARNQKIATLADFIRRLPAPLVAAGVSYLAGELPQGRLGVGYAALSDYWRAGGDGGAGGTGGGGVPPAAEATLQLGDVDRAFEAIKTTAGAGSTERRRML